jgi:hypothetical protein
MIGGLWLMARKNPVSNDQLEAGHACLSIVNEVRGLHGPLLTI